MSILCKAVSTYHLDLLDQNNLTPTHFLLKQDSKLEGKIQIRFPDAEIFSFPNEKISWNIPLALKTNNSIYKDLKTSIQNIAPTKVLLFSDNKPFDKFLIDYCLENKIEIELWEDGLGHYIGGCTNIYFFKSALKLLQGFYPKGIFKEQYKRERIVVRDRFQNKNLIYKKPKNHTAAVPRKDRVLFIGQPLVEDNYIKKQDYIFKLNFIQEKIGLPLDYLPHPREDISKYETGTNFDLIETQWSAEQFCCNFEYYQYLSAFSTTLINIEEYQNSKFLAGYFGLTKIHEALNRASFLPIKSYQNMKDDSSNKKK